MDNLNLNMLNSNQSLQTKQNYLYNLCTNPDNAPAQQDISKDTVEISSKKDKVSNNITDEKNNSPETVPPNKVNDTLTNIGKVLLYGAISFLPCALLMLLVHKMTNGKPPEINLPFFKNTFNKVNGSDVRFADVAGVDEAKNELMEIVEFLKEPQKYKDMGAKIPKGALLIGPPGTGKTMLAKAVAGEAGIPFFSVSGSEFVQMYVGLGAARVRDLFADARKNGGLIFIDEIDAIGRKRGGISDGGGSTEKESTLNQLLVEMDGFADREGVIVMAATNKPEVLDEALLRSGRFDRKVTVDLPDENGREEILKVHIKGKPLAKDVLLSTIAKKTPGFSGADLANLMNEAAISAVHNKHGKIAMSDIDEAWDKVVSGPARISFDISKKEKEITAYHETGHALLSQIIEGCDPLSRVSIMPRGMSLGQTINLPEEKRSITKPEMLAKITMILGGRAAEELHFGVDNITTGASSDMQKATQLTKDIVTSFGPVDRTLLTSENSQNQVDKEITEIINTQYERAKQLLTDHRSLLDSLSGALLEKQTLTADDFNKITGNLQKQPAT